MFYYWYAEYVFIFSCLYRRPHASIVSLCQTSTMDLPNHNYFVQMNPLQQQGEEEGESPILACLRAKKQGKMVIGNDSFLLEMPTQHSVSTLGSSLGEEGEFENWNAEGDDDDDDSNTFASFHEIEHDDDDFYDPILDELIGCHDDTTREDANNSPIRFFEETIAKAIHVASTDEDDKGFDDLLVEEEPYSGYNYEDAGLQQQGGREKQGGRDTLYRDFEGSIMPNDNNIHTSIQSQQPYLEDSTDATAVSCDNSMTSLNDAFERLNDCMDRTAQSRKLVKQLAGNATTTIYLTPSSLEEKPALFSMSRMNSSNSLCSVGSTRSCLTSSSSAGSVVSSASTSSKNSLNHCRGGSIKGPRSHTKPRRRAWKKGTLSKSGVAPRTIQAFSPTISSSIY